MFKKPHQFLFHHAPLARVNGLFYRTDAALRVWKMFEK